MKKNQIHTIVVHPGQAHRDDFLAACLALAKYRFDVRTIMRQEPSQAMLDDPCVIVLDVGKQLDPEKRNYDHHQLIDENGRPQVACALHLFVEHELGLTNAFSYFDWFKLTSWMDSQGPFATAREFGWDQFPFACMSPVESTMLRLFGDQESIEYGSALFLMMVDIGVNLLNHIEGYAEGVKACLQDTYSVSIGKCTGVVMMGDTGQIKYLNMVQRMYHSEAAFSITKDDRGDGHCLYRYDDDPRLDFSKLINHQYVIFAHPGGFIAKTVPNLSMDELLELVEAAQI